MTSPTPTNPAGDDAAQREAVRNHSGTPVLGRGADGTRARRLVSRAFGYLIALVAAVLVGLTLATVYALMPGTTAQPRVPRVGFLALGTAGLSSDVKPFQQGMGELGYVDGRNVLIEYRFADGQVERLPHLAAELVAAGVDVIVATSSPAIRAAQQATTRIPIVMGVSAEPVEHGFVRSLARPGGNITGLTSISAELSGKRLEILANIVPGLHQVGVLWDPTYPGKLLEYQALEQAATALDLHLLSLPARTPADIESAFEIASQADIQALVVIGGPVFHRSHPRIAELAALHGLPSMHETPRLLRAGGLVAYGPSNDDLFHRSAYYVDRILRGARAADLPVERPARFYLGINLQTAAALGLTVPHEMLLDAAEVVQ